MLASGRITRNDPKGDSENQGVASLWVCALGDLSRWAGSIHALKLIRQLAEKMGAGNEAGRNRMSEQEREALEAIGRVIRDEMDGLPEESSFRPLFSWMLTEFLRLAASA